MPSAGRHSGNNRRMAPLVIVTGPPGAGKSTVARLLGYRFERSVVVEGDAFFAFLARGAIPPWLPESHAQNEIVTEAAAGAAGRYAIGVSRRRMTASLVPGS